MNDSTQNSDREHVFASVDPFLDVLKSKAPTPGGGAVAALCGALAASLTRMVATLTVGKKKFVDVEEEFRAALDATDDLVQRFRRLMHDDAEVFDALMTTYKLPKDTDDEKAARREAMRMATIRAAEVPLSMIHVAAELLPLARFAAEKGNPHAVSDAGIAAQLVDVCARAAALNVRINLGSLKGDDHDRLARELDEVLPRTVEAARAVEALASERL